MTECTPAAPSICAPPLSLAVSSIVAPFGIGLGLASWLWTVDPPTDPAVTFTTFSLFLGTALSFTAFPVLARILSSANLLASPIGLMALSTAAIDDVMAWCVLAVVLAYSAGGSALLGVYTALIAIGFVAFLVVVVGPLLGRGLQHCIEKGCVRNHVAEHAQR